MLVSVGGLGYSACQGRWVGWRASLPECSLWTKCRLRGVERCGEAGRQHTCMHVVLRD